MKLKIHLIKEKQTLKILTKIKLLILLTALIFTNVSYGQMQFKYYLTHSDSTNNLILDQYKVSFTNTKSELLVIKSGINDNWRITGLIAWLIFAWLQGESDARAYTPHTDWDELSVFANDDFWYLTVRHVALGVGTIAAIKTGYDKDNIRMWKDVAGLVLIGSAIWDLSFTYERYHTPFHRLKSWYTLPNKNYITISRNNMIIFDLIRLGGGTYLLLKR